MTNKDVSAGLHRLTRLLQLTGADMHRVRAYQRAEGIVRGLAEDLNDIDPQSLDGIGASLAETIRELLQTGTTAQEQALLAEVPAGLLQVMEIPDVGPKHTRLMWEHLGVESVDDVEAAAKAGRIRDIPGLGARSEQKILANLERWRQHQSRTRRPDALALAEPLLAAVRAADGVVQASLAGSLRRGRDTIGDLDILAAAADSAAAMKAFTSHPSVEEVVLAGETKATVLLAGGVSADLRVVAPESWGAALQYFTGSQAHNIAVRGRAQRRGMTLNEYSLRRLDDDSVVASATEEEIYAALDLPWIPPELREGRGELERPLPRLLEVSDLRGDLHCHTLWSDGARSIAEMAAEAVALGHDYLAITDHSGSLNIANGLDEQRIAEQAKEIAAVREQFPDLLLLHGIEADILADGTVDLDPECTAALDLVIGSVHVHTNLPPDEMTERILAAVRSGRIHILGHPTGRLLGRRDPYEFDIDAVFAACHEHGVAVEINSQSQRLDLDDTLARRAVDAGLTIVINTDAHRLDELHTLHQGVMQARRAWLGPEPIANSVAGAPPLGRPPARRE